MADKKGNGNKKNGRKIKLMGIKEIVEYLKSHRLIAILLLAVVIAAFALIFFLSRGGQDTAQINTGEDEVNKKTNISDLSIFIPENAFPYPKSFLIENLSKNVEYDRFKEIGRYTGDIYELIPGDGRQDLALEPMTFQYIFPEEFYFGTDYNNAEMVYIKDRNTPIARIFSGGELVKNKDNRLVLQVKAFHGSLIGIRISNPEKVEWGLRKSIEKEETLKPHILIIPGIDSNFLGFLPNTITNSNPQGNNFWEVTFPDRSIWSYNYPLTQTRSENYMNSMNAFFEENSRTSYVMFEAKKLADELKNTNKTFDIIAQGIGGIIARYAVEKYGVDNVRKLVLISAPNAGTNIVNTTFLSMLYGKNPEVISQIYSTDSETVRFVESNNLSYLEKVNSFYSDILPGSRIMTELETSIRPDVEYAFMAGSYPGFDTNLEGTQLAKFYPENTPEKGDGIVSVYSALYPAIENNGEIKENLHTVIFPYSFFDIFVQKESLQFIYDFLEKGIEQVVIPKFEDDTFKEWKYEYDTNSSTYTSDIEWPFSTGTILDENTQATDTTVPTSVSTLPFSDWKKDDSNYSVGDDEKITGDSSKTDASTDSSENQATNSVKDISSTGTDADKNGIAFNASDSTHIKYPKENTGYDFTDGGVMRIFVPDSDEWRFKGFPENMESTDKIIRYEYLRTHIPEKISPYGIRSAGQSLYILAREGLVYLKSQRDIKLISQDQITATYSLDKRFYTISAGKMKSYENGVFKEESYLMNDSDVVSFAMNDSKKYFLSRFKGLTLETDTSSYKIGGNYGDISMYGVYPYVVSDNGIYLFNGEKTESIAAPYNRYSSFINGIIREDTLFVLSSDYYLSAISLDGKKHVDLPLLSIGGFKLLKDDRYLIVCGRKKLVVLDMKSARPSGSYFSLYEDETLIDGVFSQGKLILLIKNSEGETYVEKVAMIE